MAETQPKPKGHKVGAVVEVPEGGEVVRPDGSRHKVTGGSYVLDAPGAYEIDGREVIAK